MMKHCIGSCVIAMNKKIYEDLYLHMDEDAQRMEDSVRKFFQSTILNVNKLEQDYNEMVSIPEELPETRYIEFNILDLNSEIQSVTTKINNEINNYQSLIMTSIVFYNDKYIENGVYYKSKDSLIKYKHIDEEILNISNSLGNYDFSISFLLNIKNAIYANKQKGFINGLIKIGSIEHSLQHFFRANDFVIQYKELNPNIFTHALGINLTCQLLIKTLFVRKDNDFCK